MHWIERHILKALAVADSLTYSELLPDGVTGNLFQYHARALESGGLIVRSSTGYRLTSVGQQLVGTMSLTRSTRRPDQPSPVVMIYAVNAAGETLLFRWRRQPYRGQVSLPFGRLLAGSSVAAMAAKQLWYKTGLRGDLAYAGSVNLQTDAYHLLVSVFQTVNLSGELGSDGLTGTAYWGYWSDVPASEAWAGQQTILDWLGQTLRPPLLEINLSPAETSEKRL